MGLSATALPFLLTGAGVGLGRVASISALVLTPTFWGVLLAPIVDIGWTRRTHAIWLAALTILSIGAALWSLSPAHLGFLTAALLTGNLAAYLYGAALSGWLADFVPDSMRGKVGGWAQAANLGGAAGGGLITMELAQKASLHVAAAGLVLLLSLAMIPIFSLPRAAQPKLKLRRAIQDTGRGIWETCKQKSTLIGLALFLSPTGAFGISNLFSGLGKDFHASDQQVILLTGLGVAIACSLGSICGGYLADRFPRGYLYLSGGMIAACFGLILSFSDPTPVHFIVAVLGYSAAAGVTYAAWQALALQFTGAGHAVAGTQMTVFASVANGAISYMTWADGRGYDAFGARGALFLDGGASLLAAIPLLLLVRHGLGKKPRTPAIEALEPVSGD
jgi:MFS family permease